MRQATAVNADRAFLFTTVPLKRYLKLQSEDHLAKLFRDRVHGVVGNSTSKRTASASFRGSQHISECNHNLPGQSSRNRMALGRKSTPFLGLKFIDSGRTFVTDIAGGGIFRLSKLSTKSRLAVL